MVTRKNLSKALIYTLRALPLAGAAASVSLPLGRYAQQFMVLIVLLWVQVYFVLDVFIAGR